MIRLLPLVLLLACSGTDPETEDTEEPHPWAGHPLFEDEFFNVAHRGGGEDRPEMTMAAFEHAIAVGADMLEIDVHMTIDGTLMLIHDDSVDRTTDGTGSIKTLTQAEVQALDAGYTYTSDGGSTYPYRGTGITIPTLEEVLAEYPNATFSIEIKQSDPPIVTPLLALLDAHDAGDRVVVSSFEDGPIAELRDERPEILTGLTTTEAFALFYLDDSDWDEYEPPTYFFAAPYTFAGIQLDQETIDKSHHFGITVHVWTVNDQAEMEEVVGWGANGLITDDPELLDSVLTTASQ